jgi:hypothetical protein
VERGPRKPEKRTAPLRNLAPLPAILLGAWVAHLHGVPLTAFIPNAAAVAIGVPSVYLISRTRALRESYLLACVSAILIATTLISPGISGVHRWLKLGPLFLNASMAFGPLILHGIALSFKRNATPIALLLCLSLSIQVTQPDASQATAIACAVTVLAWLGKNTAPKLSIFCTSSACLAAIISWLRNDPLQPVPHVEHILHLAAESGPLMLAACLLSIALLFVPILSIKSQNADASFKAAFAVYLAIELLSTELGHFPVPVLGAGAAGVLGWYFAFGLSSAI